MTAEALMAMYAARGFPCEIEVATRGLVVYAASKAHTDGIVRDIAKAARERDARAMWTPSRKDPDEGAATAWWAAVEFDWKRF